MIDEHNNKRINGRSIGREKGNKWNLKRPRKIFLAVFKFKHSLIRYMIRRDSEGEG
jgi:hypothetical protein